VATLWVPLEERLPQGVGGVAEYGITARWDKNFLTLVRLILERRSLCGLQGALRFGSSFSPSQAFSWGIDHIALCLGAGPSHLPSFVTQCPAGVRLATDFLMALHVGAAHHLEARSALQIQLPVVVIGGGLTAIDAATEAMAFYGRQVEKLALMEERGVIVDVEPEDVPLLTTFRDHAAQLKGLSPLARALQINAWGGVTVLYRGALAQAPSVRVNPHEVREALAQGVRIREHAVPIRFLTDPKGFVTGVVLADGEVVPARTVLLATGLVPNTVLWDECPELHKDPRISRWGDLDPRYHGSVVKAMASAKDGYEKLSRLLNASETAFRSIPDHAFLAQMEAFFEGAVEKVVREENATLSLTVSSPYPALQKAWGQYFKLQQRGLRSEGIALKAAQLDPVKGQLTFQVKEAGASSHGLFALRPGERVSLMGPLGLPHPPEERECPQAPALLQCMMHQLCGQCVHVSTHPLTGERRVVYLCQDPCHPEGDLDEASLHARAAHSRIMQRALWAFARKKG
jgi:NADPH-dependent glutamate synthase beta subunit-like oxidoreductase